MTAGYTFMEIGTGETEEIKNLFTSVFTEEPWNDDWSDPEQLHAYILDLVGQSNSLTYGLYEDGELIAVSMGRIKHWYSGTEYCIDELCVKEEKQGRGIGTAFLRMIEAGIKGIGAVHIFLETEKDVPAYGFYTKNGYHELENHVAFSKRVK